MIIANIDKAYPINEAWLRSVLVHLAKRMSCEGAEVEVFNPRPNNFSLFLGGHVFHLEIQDYTAQLIDCESGETILAAVSEGESFEEDLARAVVSEVIAYI